MSNLKIKVYKPGELQATEAGPILNKIVSLVNDSFSAHEDFLNVTRFPKQEDIFTMMGDDGLCSILYEDATPEIKIIATASVRPWGLRKDEIDVDDTHVEKGRDYEICAVAGRFDPEYAQKGNALRATEAVVAALPCFNTSDPVRSIRAWVITASQKSSYWRRRGFEVTREQPMKAGFWNCRKDFSVLTMRKELENPNRSQ